MVHIRDPNHSMWRKIMWELDYHINVYIYIHYSDFFVLEPELCRRDRESLETCETSDNTTIYKNTWLWYQGRRAKLVMAPVCWHQGTWLLLAANTSCRRLWGCIWSHGVSWPFHNFSPLSLYWGNMEANATSEEEVVNCAHAYEGKINHSEMGVAHRCTTFVMLK